MSWIRHISNHLGHRWVALGLAGCCLSWPALAHAEELTLNEAVQRAVDRAPGLQASDAGLRAAQARLRATKSSWWPQLLLVAAYRYASPVPELDITIPGAPPGTDIAPDIGTEHTAYGGLELRWRALDVSRFSTIDSAETRVTVAELDEDDQVLVLEERVRRLYLTIRYLDEVVAVTKAAERNAEQALQERQALLDAGLGSEVDVAAAEARVAEVRARRIQADANRRAAEESLKTLLGMDADERLVPTDGWDELTSISNRARNGARNQQSQKHPAVKSLQASATASRQEADAAWSRWYPTIDVKATVDYRYPQTFVDDEAGPTWSAGVQLTWLLWDGGARDAQEEALLAKAEAEEAAAVAREEALTVQSIEAQSTIDAAESQLLSASAQQETAQAYLNLARASVDAGAANELDVMNAEVAVEQAGLAVATAKFELAMAHSGLLKSLGIVQSVGSRERAAADEIDNGGTP